MDLLLPNVRAEAGPTAKRQARAVEKCASPLRGPGVLMLGLASSEGLGSKVVVVVVTADPEPVHTLWLGQSKRPVVKADPGAVHLSEKLEL